MLIPSKLSYMKTSVITRLIRTVGSVGRKINNKLKEDPSAMRDHHRKILQERLELNSYQTCMVLKRMNLTCTHGDFDLDRTIRMLKRLGFTNREIVKNPGCMNFTEWMLDNNASYLREAGMVKVDTPMLIRFRNLIKRPVVFLKSHGLISDETDVMRNMCMSLKPTPVNSLLSETTDEDSILQMHDVALRSYLVSFGKDLVDVNRLYNTYDRLRYKSLRLISEVVELLIEEIKLDHARILSHVYLLEIHPKSLKNLLRTFPTLGGVDIRTVLTKTPKLMTVPVRSIKEILGYFRAYEISDEAIQKCYDIFTLSPDSVFNRLQQFERNPEFGIYWKNPRILLLLLSHNKVKMRMKILKNNNVKCSSLHVLCSSSSVFERYALDGNDRTNGDDIINYLHAELKLPLWEIRNALSCNQHWYHVPFISVQNSYEFLKSKGYRKSNIAKFPVVLLYTKEQLEGALKEVRERVAKMKRNVNGSQILNLCVYLLEKPFHFSGNGVWDTNNTTKLEEKQL